MLTELAKMREVVMAGSLKEEEGSEDLPGQGATRSEEDGSAAELEKPRINQLPDGGATIFQEIPVEPRVDGLQVSRVVKVTVQKAATPEREGGKIGMQGGDQSGKFLPGEIEGKLEEHGFEEEAGGKGGLPALVFPILVQYCLEGIEDRLDQPPLLTGQEETGGGRGVRG
jgi:hypothetical protein